MLLSRTFDKPASCQCSFCRFGAWASRKVPLEASAAAPKDSWPAQQHSHGQDRLMSLCVTACR